MGCNGYCFRAILVVELKIGQGTITQSIMGIYIIAKYGQFHYYRQKWHNMNHLSCSSENKNMSIPDYQTVMLPLLKLVAKYGQIKMSDVTQLIADEFRLTEEERRELLPSGKQPIIQNRVAWARTYLKKAGLLDSPQRGVIEISDRGKKVLSENPKTIDVIFLR